MSVKPASKRCFVIGPIGAEDSEARIHADWLFSAIIQPVFAEHFADFVVERADRLANLGMVTSRIINRLYDSELVIADMSFHNANVFYEMAVRHNVGKPIIHMIRKADQIPFDVIPQRAISFSIQRAGDVETAKKVLRPAVREALEPSFRIDNPVIHARGQLKLQEEASPAMQVISDEMAALRSQIAILQQQLAMPRLQIEPTLDMSKLPAADLESLANTLDPNRRLPNGFVDGWGGNAVTGDVDDRET
jgi:hypothetical protein